MGQFCPTMNMVFLLLSGLLYLCQGSPIQIQTFLVETNTSVLCREGGCISEDPDKIKCPEDFFEDECPEYAEYCGALSHRGQWMTLFCKRTCHCQNSPGEDQCCPSLIEDKSGGGINENVVKINESKDTKNEGMSNVHEINVGEKNEENEDSDSNGSDQNENEKENAPTTVPYPTTNTGTKKHNLGAVSGNEDAATDSEEIISTEED